jgi:hypothetical protein
MNTSGSSWVTAFTLAIVAVNCCNLAGQQPSATPRATTIGPMTVGIPVDWPAGPEQGPNVASFFITGGTAPQQSMVTLTAVRGNGEDVNTAHQMIWATYTKPHSWNRIGSGNVGQFQWSEMISRNQNGQQGWHRLYSTSSAGMHIVAVLVAASIPEFNRVRPVIDRLIASARFGNSPEAAAVSAAATVPSSSPTMADDVPIVEAHVHIEMRGFSSTSSVLTDHILFFANGLVAREGVINGPRECYALYNVGRLSRLPLNYGRWTEDKVAGVVRIQWQEGQPWTLQRSGTRLVLGGKALLQLRPIDGMQLNGTYAYRSVTGEMSQLEFRAGGLFSAANLIDSMSCGTQLRPGALAGSGTYEIRKWTLILRFSNGAITALPLHIESDQDPQRVTKFWLKSHDFVRVR